MYEDLEDELSECGFHCDKPWVKSSHFLKFFRAKKQQLILFLDELDSVMATSSKDDLLHTLRKLKTDPGKFRKTAIKACLLVIFWLILDRQSSV